MATHHDSHGSGSSFWGCANIFFGLGFAVCALVSGGWLLVGGIKSGLAGKPVPPAPAEAAAAPAAGAPAATASAPADPNAVTVTIRPGSTNPMSYDTTTITAKSGQKVRITFENTHPTAPLQHNLIICKPGSKERMVAASNAMMLELPKWMAKDLVPDSPDVLHHTKLLNAGQSETLEFTAPEEKGDYPYLCTFPGHSLIMFGNFKVE